MRSVFTKTLYDLRWTVLAFCVALGALSFCILYVYPEVAKQQQSVVNSLSPQVAQSFGLATSPKGFLSIQMFAFQPLYLAVFLIIVTSAAIAGEEGENTLGQLLVRPIPRWLILTEKALAIVVGLALITLATAVGALLGAYGANVSINHRDLAWSIVNTAPFGFWLVGFGLFCSAFFRRRMTAALVATGVVVAGYMLNSLSDFVTGLKTYNHFSPMYYYAWGEPLLKSVHWNNMVVLAMAGLVFYLLALFAFQRREVVG
jgi:ABC-type transport system involved in multi-copper enzyme maturation permease subunit